MNQPPNFAGFGLRPLDDMVAVGAVTEDRALVWLRAARPCTVRVTYIAAGNPAERSAMGRIEPDNASDNTGRIELTELEPDTRYEFEVWDTDESRRIGAGRFRTAPARGTNGPDDFAFAVSSCHLPFEHDGSVAKAATDMLAAARACCEQNDVRFQLDIGDQMYADMPRRLSLFDADHFARVAPAGRSRLQQCSREEVRRLYQDRYRFFGSLPDWRAVRETRATYSIWDDHEVVDNWGSDPAHQSETWQGIAAGAKRACFDYQASRGFLADGERDTDFDQVIDHGDVSVYIMDLRSNRTGGDEGRVVSTDQQQRFRRFLAERRGHAALFFVLSVPLIHGPRWISALGARVWPGSDFGDRWSALGHRHDRDRMLETLREHRQLCPSQKLVLLSGDVHVGAMHEIRWPMVPGTIHQFTSSALTNDGGRLLRSLSGMITRLARSMRTPSHRAKVRLAEVEGSNPVPRLNLGIVRLRRNQSGGRDVCLELFGANGTEPVRLLRSRWL